MGSGDAVPNSKGRWRRFAAVGFILIVAVGVIQFVYQLETRDSFEYRVSQIRPGMAPQRVTEIMGPSVTVTRVRDTDTLIYGRSPSPVQVFFRRAVNSVGIDLYEDEAPLFVFVEYEDGKVKEILKVP